MADSATVKTALGALRMLANNAANKVAVASAGGIAVIIEALRTHADDSDIVKEAGGALRNL